MYQFLGLLECGEVTTGLHDAPTLDIVGPFGYAAHWHDNFMGKGGYSRGDGDVTRRITLRMGGLIVRRSSLPDLSANH